MNLFLKNVWTNATSVKVPKTGEKPKSNTRPVEAATIQAGATSPEGSLSPMVYVMEQIALAYRSVRDLHAILPLQGSSSSLVALLRSDFQPGVNKL